MILQSFFCIFALDKIRKHSMNRLFKYLLLLIFIGSSAALFAQKSKLRDMYQVKKKDTIYGIAKMYGLTVDELVRANPEMTQPDYVLKKDSYIMIPFHQEEAVAAPVKANTNAPKVQTVATSSKNVTIGVMLPLHNNDGDGRRMLEYYRGVLMACDSLKLQNISVQVNTWNVDINADIKQFLSEPNLEKCDIIFGPLYTKQVKPLADYCKVKKIKLVIPFSITGNEVATNSQIFQVYQSNSLFNEKAIGVFLSKFKSYHPIFIDCNDASSDKGIFTFGLRKKLEEQGISYGITNLKSSNEMFANVFSSTKPNIVILNTARSPELNSALAKLDALLAKRSDLKITTWGYTEWLMYTKVYSDYFFKYDTYIPTTFFFNPWQTSTRGLEANYKRWFNTDMQQALPRFAITGYDHAQFFINGIVKYGKSFTGSTTENSYKAVQTPLHFKRVSNVGGLQNTNFMLVHYLNNRTIQTINY